MDDAFDGGVEVPRLASHLGPLHRHGAAPVGVPLQRRAVRARFKRLRLTVLVLNDASVLEGFNARPVRVGLQLDAPRAPLRSAS